MHHQPAPDSGDDASAGYKTRLGLVLFAIYGLFYAGFVLINTFAPAAMGQVVFMGMNLAVTYGFGLIVLAIVMALIYHVLCVRAENRMNAPEGDADHDV